MDYKINLARLFCKEGLNIVLGNPPFLRDELRHKNYHAIFLEKGANPDPLYYQKLCHKGIYLYDLSDEGAAEPVYSINYQPAVDSLKTMKKIFLWGNAQQDDLVWRNPDAALQEKYFIVGNPGFDLCTKKYKPFNIALKPNNIPASYILVNTNFGCKQSYRIEAHLEACNLISPSTKLMMENAYKKEAMEWPIFQEWLENIIQTFPEQRFLIRPHPVEIQENYEKIFKKYKNVLISKKGNVNYMIASAKIVLHKDCSTAMQAYLMGVPSISLGGESLYKNYTAWPFHFSALPKDINEAKELVTQILATGDMVGNLKHQIDKKANTFLEQNFCNLGNSTQALVDIIVKDAEDLIKNLTPYKLIDSRTPIQKFKLFFRKRMPLYYKVPKSARETLVKFTKKDIVKRLDLLESVDPMNIRLFVKKVFPNTFQIHRV